MTTRLRSWIVSTQTRKRIAIIRAASRESAATIHATRLGHDPPTQLSEKWFIVAGQRLHVSGPHPDTTGPVYQPLKD
jgi:hypothetical protein